MSINADNYGTGHASYRAAGELAGLIKLVDAFFEYMEQLKEAKQVRALYPADLTLPRKKLTYFLSGWLGGPRLYAQHYGEINIPAAHRHLAISEENSQAWILCMQKAVEQQAYAESFKTYLIKQLEIPAQRIVMACRKE